MFLILLLSIGFQFDICLVLCLQFQFFGQQSSLELSAVQTLVDLQAFKAAFSDCRISGI